MTKLRIKKLERKRSRVKRPEVKKLVIKRLKKVVEGSGKLVAKELGVTESKIKRPKK